MDENGNGSSPGEGEGHFVDVADIVHYVLPQRSVHSGACRPAIVLRVHDRKTGSARLRVFFDGPEDHPAWGLVGDMDNVTARYSAYQKPGSWHYPELSHDAR